MPAALARGTGRMRSNVDVRSIPHRPQASPLFHGESYQPKHDARRLTTQLDLVRELMADEHWRTLTEIREAIGKGSETGIGARLRDLRRPEHGGYQVDRRRRGAPRDGVFEYRVRPASEAAR